MIIKYDTDKQHYFYYEDVLGYPRKQTHEDRGVLIHEAICKAFNVCPECVGQGYHEKLGDGVNFEVDVVGTTTCQSCNGTGEYV